MHWAFKSKKGKGAAAPKLTSGYRSKLEERAAKQLETAGVTFAYEKEKLEYVVPSRTAKYTPDFVLTKLDGSKLYIETKGRFGGTHGRSSAEERQKMILVKEQHPSLDIRMVFEKASTPIYKGSKTTYANWSDAHGFPWADKGVIPNEWLKEIHHG